jgi:surfeit locus 1 family protein
MSRLTLRQWIFVAIVVAVAAACVRLGIWQLERLAERRASNATIRARLALDPVPLPSAIPDPQAWAYRHVTARGVFDAEREVLLSNRSLEGQPGVHLITPLWIEAIQAAVLVDRGWIPLDSSPREGRARFAVSDAVQVTGIIRLSQPEPSLRFLADPTRAPGGSPVETWRFLHIASMQGQFPYPVLPFYIEATAPTTTSGLPKPDLVIDLSDGPHLSYAIQWFAFATISLVGGAFWLRQALASRPMRSSKEGRP